MSVIGVNYFLQQYLRLKLYTIGIVGVGTLVGVSRTKPDGNSHSLRFCTNRRDEDNANAIVMCNNDYARGKERPGSRMGLEVGVTERLGDALVRTEC